MRDGFKFSFSNFIFVCQIIPSCIMPLKLFGRSRLCFCCFAVVVTKHHFPVGPVLLEECWSLLPFSVVWETAVQSSPFTQDNTFSDPRVVLIPGMVVLLSFAEGVETERGSPRALELRGHFIALSQLWQGGLGVGSKAVSTAGLGLQHCTAGATAQSCRLCGNMIT